MPKQTSFYRDVHCFYERRGRGGAHPYHKTCKRGGRGLTVRQSSFKFVERGLLGVGSRVGTNLVYLIFIYHLICLFSRCLYKKLWAELGGCCLNFFKYIFRNILNMRKNVNWLWRGQFRDWFMALITSLFTLQVSFLKVV